MTRKDRDPGSGACPDTRSLCPALLDAPDSCDDNMRQIGAPLKKQGVGATFAPEPEYRHVQPLESVFYGFARFQLEV